MATYFFDSSALVKRYVTEIGTGWIDSLTHPYAASSIWIVRIAAVELASAVARRRRNGSLPPAQSTAVLSQFSHDLIGDYRIVEVSPPLLQSAMILAERHTLRAYDAVQLAAAVELHRLREAGQQPLATFVSGDRDLNRAGTAEGLVVDDPHDHP